MTVPTNDKRATANTPVACIMVCSKADFSKPSPPKKSVAKIPANRVPIIPPTP